MKVKAYAPHVKAKQGMKHRKSRGRAHVVPYRQKTDNLRIFTESGKEFSSKNTLFVFELKTQSNNVRRDVAYWMQRLGLKSRCIQTFGTVPNAAGKFSQMWMHLANDKVKGETSSIEVHEIWGAEEAVATFWEVGDKRGWVVNAYGAENTSVGRGAMGTTADSNIRQRKFPLYARGTMDIIRREDEAANLAAKAKNQGETDDVRLSILFGEGK